MGATNPGAGAGGADRGRGRRHGRGGGPHTGPLGRHWGLAWEYGLYKKPFLDALAGDCAPLISAFGRAQWRTRAIEHAVLAERHDRGVCTAFDPAAAYRHFEAAVARGAVRFHAVLGWKHANGHGVVRSDARAGAHFRAFLLALAPHPPAVIDRIVATHLQDRPMVVDLAEGLAWLRRQKADPARMIALARGLLAGTARAPDGETFPHSVHTARTILEWMADEPDAQYWLGIEGLRGTFGLDYIEDAQARLLRAGWCKSVKALHAVAVRFEHGLEGFPVSYPNAYAWYRMAWSYGAEVDAAIERLGPRLDDLERAKVESRVRSGDSINFCIPG